MCLFVCLFICLFVCLWTQKRREVSVHCLGHAYYTTQALICIPLQLMISMMALVVMVMMMTMIVLTMAVLMAMMCFPLCNNRHLLQHLPCTVWLSVTHMRHVFPVWNISGPVLDCSHVICAKICRKSLVENGASLLRWLISECSQDWPKGVRGIIAAQYTGFTNILPQIIL